MLFLKAFILGFSVSAPVGPIGLLCIQRSLSRGRIAGFLTGFGAVTANLIYASIAALGLSIVSTYLVNKEFYLELIGGVFLFYLGVKTFIKKPADNAASLKGETLFQMYISTFILMITNPTTILNFAAMFSGLGINIEEGTSLSKLALISGVFVGSSLWWVILSIGVSFFRKKIIRHLVLINKVAGGLLIVLGILALIK